jgi:predicted hotdog family 3-hydroxylacyl-ACP dehydratase
MAAERLIPHRPPMRLVDRLLAFSGGSGTTESRIPADSVMAGADGAIDPAALVELIAQSYATVKGYADLAGGVPVSEGFLVGIRKLGITGKAYANERLLTTVETVGTFEGFSVVEGTVARDGEKLAAGTLKLWIAGRAGNAGDRP